MTAPPTYLPPSRNAVEVDGVKYLAGRGQVDTHRGEPVRVSYVLQQADGLAKIQTLAQVCGGQAGTLAHASRRQVGSTVTQQESLTTLKWDVTFAVNESVRPGALIDLLGSWYYVRSTRVSDTGFLVCEADGVGADAVSVSTVKVQSMDRVTERTQTTQTQATTVLLPWTSEFLVGHGSDGRPEPGQRTLVLPAGVGTVGSKVERTDGVWLIQGVDPHPHQGITLTRVRRV